LSADVRTVLKYALPVPFAKDGGRKQLNSRAIYTARRQSPSCALLILVKIYYSFNRWRENTEGLVFDNVDHNRVENSVTSLQVVDRIISNCCSGSCLNN
jgi:hypothetical protein